MESTELLDSKMLFGFAIIIAMIMYIRNVALKDYKEKYSECNKKFYDPVTHAYTYKRRNGEIKISSVYELIGHLKMISDDEFNGERGQIFNWVNKYVNLDTHEKKENEISRTNLAETLGKLFIDKITKITHGQRILHGVNLMLVLVAVIISFNFSDAAAKRIGLTNFIYYHMIGLITVIALLFISGIFLRTVMSIQQVAIRYGLAIIFLVTLGIITTKSIFYTKFFISELIVVLTSAFFMMHVFTYDGKNIINYSLNLKMHENRVNSKPNKETTLETTLE